MKAGVCPDSKNHRNDIDSISIDIESISFRCFFPIWDNHDYHVHAAAKSYQERGLCAWLVGRGGAEQAAAPDDPALRCVGDGTFDSLSWIPASARMLIAVDLLSPEVDPAVTLLAEHARSGEHALPLLVDLDVSVPINWAYNHHYMLWMTGNHAELRYVDPDPTDTSCHGAPCRWKAFDLPGAAESASWSIFAAQSRRSDGRCADGSAQAAGGAGGGRAVASAVARAWYA